MAFASASRAPYTWSRLPRSFGSPVSPVTRSAASLYDRAETNWASNWAGSVIRAVYSRYASGSSERMYFCVPAAADTTVYSRGTAGFLVPAPTILRGARQSAG